MKKPKAKGKNSTNAYTVIPYKKIKLNTSTFNQGLLNATQRNTEIKRYVKACIFRKSPKKMDML